MMRLLVSLLLLLTTACSSFQEFVPREQATGESPTGKLAAEYPLPESLGDVRVWCHGVWNETTAEGEERLVVHVGLEIENRSSVPISVDESTLRVVGLSSGSTVWPDVVDPRRDGRATVAPGEAGTVHFLFAQPEDMWASSVKAFDVEWSVLDDQGELLRQITPFRAYRRPRPDVYFAPAFFFGPRFVFRGSFWGC